MSPFIIAKSRQCIRSPAIVKSLEQRRGERGDMTEDLTNHSRIRKSDT